MKKLLIPAFLAVVALANAEELKLSNYILNTTFGGDARVKYVSTNYDETSDSDFFTTRLRLNTTTKINDNFSFGSRIRLQEEPIGNDSSGTITLNRLYLDYKNGNNSIRVGRFGSPIYLLNDVLIDTDVEGFSYATKLNNSQLRAGYLLKNASTTTETSDENSIIYGQGIQTFDIGKNKLLVEVSAYVEDNKKSSPESEAKKALTLGAEYTQNIGVGIEIAKIKGQYVITDADNDNTGYSAGITVGSKDLTQKGSWQGVLEYKSIEKNGFIYVNSDTALNKEITKVGFTTYVAQSTNLELSYEIHDFKDTTSDKNVFGAILNYAF